MFGTYVMRNIINLERLNSRIYEATGISIYIFHANLVSPDVYIVYYTILKILVLNSLTNFFYGCYVF